ncbi:MAG: peptidoglycan editing factor PgeF [Alphaproteobacteria bacterium]|nr:peptidoglycan editing factor PgeF [Alphaproteobacteria bacterium]
MTNAPLPRHAAQGLAAPGVVHGFFTRAGGVSTGLYRSLNCGYGSGDAREAVAANRAAAARALGLPDAPVLTCYQIHSARAAIVREGFPPDAAPQADALATREEGLVLGVLAADCAPVLLADPRARVVAAAHAGWKGALGGILEASLAAMEELGATRAGIRAAVGPAISGPAYEVGPEFEQRFLEADAANARFFVRPETAARARFDLPAYVRARLAAAGVGLVETLGLCTYAGEDEFFSFRRATHRGEGDYGRNLSAIALAPA